MAWTPYEGAGWVPPLIATAPIPGSATLGPRWGRILDRGYRLPPKPHQRAVLDVAGELVRDPTTTTGWRRRYATVVLTLPRQCGKTTIVGGVSAAECLLVPRTEVAYTAQTGQDARKRFDEMRLGLAQSPALRGMFRPRLSSGSERLEWSNGSMFRKFTPSADANHGDHKDVVMFDESYSHDAAHGEMLEQGIIPTFNARQHHGFGTQLWIISTMGHAGSGWLQKWVKLGRDAAAQEPGSTSVAYFEWAADPGLAWDDPATWVASHPGLAAGLTTVEWIAKAAETMDESEFRRAYLNQERGARAGAIPSMEWAQARDPLSQTVGAVRIALEVSWDRSRASIGVAGLRADGKLHLEVVEVRQGLWGLVERCAELSARWRCPISLDPVGPAGTLADDLERARVRVDRLTWADVAAACGQFWDRLSEGRLRHLGQASLDRAVADAQRRDVGDRWAWDRRRSASDVGPLMAVTIAGHRAAPGTRRAATRSVAA